MQLGFVKKLAHPSSVCIVTLQVYNQSFVYVSGKERGVWPGSFANCMELRSLPPVATF